MGSAEKTGIENAWLVGFGFRPTDDELINHHLTRKLRGLGEAVRVIPELNIYQWEPQTLFERYNAMSDYPSDGGECFFYCPRDGKNRKTQTGFWKETRNKRPFRGCDGEEIGSKRIFTYHEGRQPYGRKSQFSMHQYHLNCCSNTTIGADQGPAMEFVLCRIINRKVKKIKPDSPSESIEPDLISPGGTAFNQGGKDNESSPQVWDPQHNLKEAEAWAGHGNGFEIEFLEDGSVINETHQFSFDDPFDVPVNDRDYGPDGWVSISELLGLAETQLSGSISDMGEFGVA